MKMVMVDFGKNDDYPQGSTDDLSKRSADDHYQLSMIWCNKDNAMVVYLGQLLRPISE